MEQRPAAILALDLAQIAREALFERLVASSSIVPR